MWKILKWILIILAVMAVLGYLDEKKKKKAAEMKKAKDYARAKELMIAEKYSEAVPAFIALGDYKDSAELAEACEPKRLEEVYNKAVHRFENGKYSEAYSLFWSLPMKYKKREYFMERIQEENEKQKQEQERETNYNMAVRLFEAGKYYDAGRAFSNLPAGYKKREDFLERILDEKYKLAIQDYKEGYYWKTIGLFAALPKGYKERDEYLLRSQDGLYRKAIECYEQGSYRKAREWFQDVPEGYKDRDTYFRSACEKEFGIDFCAKSPDYRHSWEGSGKPVQEGSICIGLKKCRFCGKETTFYYDPYELGV